MILYTMMPHELIFPYEEDAQSRQIMINYEGIPLLVEQTSQQNLQIIRVLSSDPQHFMDERFYPGSKISFTNIEGLSSF
jgi:hypothetical protein